MFSSLLAFLTVILSYFEDFLPRDYLTWADWGFLQMWYYCKGCHIRFGDNTTDSTTCVHGNIKTDSQRQKTLNVFLFSLSDQQLITGPAMIVGALAQNCRISCYEF